MTILLYQNMKFPVLLHPKFYFSWVYLEGKDISAPSNCASGYKL